MVPWKLRKRQILLGNQNIPSVYFSACEQQPFSCHDLAKDIIYSKNCQNCVHAATLKDMKDVSLTTLCILMNGKPQIACNSCKYCYYSQRSQIQLVECVFIMDNRSFYYPWFSLFFLSSN